MQGRYQEATEQYKIALTLKNDDAAGYFFLGQIYLKSGEFDRAQASFKSAAQMSDDFTEEIKEMQFRHKNNSDYGGGDMET